MKPASLALLALLPAWAQETPLFRSSTELATLRFHVVRDRHYVTALTRQDVILLEDGVPRPFTLFVNASTAEEIAPVAVTLLFDTSGSVTEAGLLDPLVFQQSLFQSLPAVTMSVYGFGKTLTRYTGPTREFERLRDAIAGLQRKGKGEAVPIALPPKRHADPRGATWLYEAVAGAAREAASGARDVTRLMLVFSDGFPTTDTYVEDILPALHEAGVAVYPIVLGHAQLAESARLEEEKLATRDWKGEVPHSAKLDAIEASERRIDEFKRLAVVTGGQSFDPREITLDVMKQILQFLVAQVRTEYVIGFQSQPSERPRRHRLEVRLRDKDAGKLSGGTRSLVY